MAKTPEKSLVLIAGPTASGKSALAMQLAQQRNGVIINADSMQVYRDLRILTARPRVEDEALVPHRLFGHVSGTEDYSVGRWLTEAKGEILATWAEGKLPILVGGTGLYFTALTQGLAEIPSIPPEIRDKWRNFSGNLHHELARRDPATAAKLRPSDRQRLIRALEVFESTGKSLSAFQEARQESDFLREINVERLFVHVSREELYRRAERRFDQMIASGALDEVRALDEIARDRPILKAIGVRELRSVLSGEKELQVAITEAKTATRRYMKRQLTWWRGKMKDWALVDNRD